MCNIRFHFIGFLLLSAFLARFEAKGPRKKTEPVQRKAPLRQPVKHSPARKKIPGISNLPPSAQKSTSSSEATIKVDKDLTIKFPGKKKAIDSRQFIFEPYQQKFVAEVVRTMHVALPEIDEDVMRLGFQKNSYFKSLRLLIQATHFMDLLIQHPIHQLRRDALIPLRRLINKITASLVMEIQKNPDRQLKATKKYLLELEFEDIYIIDHFYKSVLDHVLGVNLVDGKEAYEWMEEQHDNYTNVDARFTYRSYLNRNPEKVLKDFNKYLQVLLFENIHALLPIRSITYLKEARSLLEGLKLLKPDAAVIRKLDLEVEFSKLHFEPFEDNSEIYENLMKIFPSIPGNRKFFGEDKEKAWLFFPFFDQLQNYADRRFNRGRYACMEALAFDREACLQHWRSAAETYRYIARYAPFTTLVRKSILQLDSIEKNKVIEYPFVSKTELLELKDTANRPYL